MRSFWPDQRIDGGLWKMDRWFDRQLYRYFKNVERRLISCSDGIVVLTNKAKVELDAIVRGGTDKAVVIPCCADFEAFSLPSPQEKGATRRSLGLAENALVVGYLGSLGTWYMLDDMLTMFGLIKLRDPNAQMFFISQDWNESSERAVDRSGLRSVRSDIIVRPAVREQVSEMIGACDVMLAFYRPGYSHLATSPTKFGEACACGVPTICNVGVGDMAEIVPALGAGAIVDTDSLASMEKTAQNIHEIAAGGGPRLREAARHILGLEIGGGRYIELYRSLLEDGRQSASQ